MTALNNCLKIYKGKKATYAIKTVRLFSVLLDLGSKIRTVNFGAPRADGEFL